MNKPTEINQVNDIVDELDPDKKKCPQCKKYRHKDDYVIEGSPSPIFKPKGSRIITNNCISCRSNPYPKLFGRPE